MGALAWDLEGDRFYESALDRGVLYLPSGGAVPWYGLTSVDDNFEESSTPFWFDGVKYLDAESTGDFSAKLNAITYPDEFLEFEGISSLGDGMFIDDQPPKRFGLSYRTGVGNDLVGLDYGQKIHLLYNLIATVDIKENQTRAQIAKPHEFSWSLAGVPEEVPGYKPTTHLIVDTTEMTPFGLSALESLLYGWSSGIPRLPTPKELMEVFPWQGRPIWVVEIAGPEGEFLPLGVQEGDLIFQTSDHAVFSMGEQSPHARPVIVISEGEALPDYAYPQDLVYNQTTGIIYRLS